MIGIYYETLSKKQEKCNKSEEGLIEFDAGIQLSATRAYDTN